MKVNIPVRFKNPWFWIGVVATILAAIGVNPEMFTSWEILGKSIMSVLSNPYQIGCIIIAVLGIFVDPTTAGFKDSNRALGYIKPFKDEKNE